jgi:hypothetical protein
MRRASGGGQQQRDIELELLKNEVQVRSWLMMGHAREVLALIPYYPPPTRTQRLRQHVPACRRIPKLLVLDLNGLLVHRVFIGEGPRAGERRKKGGRVWGKRDVRYKGS